MLIIIHINYICAVLEKEKINTITLFVVKLPVTSQHLNISFNIIKLTRIYQYIIFSIGHLMVYKTAKYVTSVFVSNFVFF